MGDVVTVPLRGVLFPIRLIEAEMPHGPPVKSPGVEFGPMIAGGPGDDYIAGAYYSVAGNRYVWRCIRYIPRTGTAVRGPVRYGTPGDIVVARMGGGRKTLDAVNRAVYARWPHLKPEDRP